MRYFLILFFILSPFSFAISDELETVIRGTDENSEAPHGLGNVYGADIVRHNDKFLMYYGGQGRDGHDRIHLATSSDARIWSPKGVVFAPLEINHVNDPSVAIVNGRLFMFHTRALAGVTDTIGLATSADGYRWEDQGSVFLPSKFPAWDSLLVGRPSVIHDGERFRMWFDGRADLPPGAPDTTAPKSATSQRYVGYAESNDGIHWSRRPDFVLAGDAGGVHVVKVHEQLLMLIESREGTRLAISTDGLAWRDRGLLAAKDPQASPHGHVTPFLCLLTGQPTLYFGAAMSEQWNRNSIMRQILKRNLEDIPN
jgi:hypothetical protein